MCRASSTSSPWIGGCLGRVVLQSSKLLEHFYMYGTLWRKTPCLIELWLHEATVLLDDAALHLSCGSLCRLLCTLGTKGIGMVSKKGCALAELRQVENSLPPWLPWSPTETKLLWEGQGPLLKWLKEGVALKTLTTSNKEFKQVWPWACYAVSNPSLLTCARFGGRPFPWSPAPVHISWLNSGGNDACS